MGYNITKIIKDREPMFFKCFIYGNRKGKFLGKFKECYSYYTFNYKKMKLNRYQINIYE